MFFFWRGGGEAEGGGFKPKNVLEEGMGLSGTTLSGSCDLTIK